MLSITIDDRALQAEAGELVVDVINHVGGTLPQVCYHPQLGLVQTCDTCMVEFQPNLLVWQRVLGSIEPEWFKAIFLAIPEGIAKATAERDKPVSIFGLLRRVFSKDSLRAMSAAVDFLEAFGRPLYLAETKTAANTEIMD